jgi:hypothetical protein
MNIASGFYNVASTWLSGFYNRDIAFQLRQRDADMADTAFRVTPTWDIEQ